MRRTKGIVKQLQKETPKCLYLELFTVLLLCCLSFTFDTASFGVLNQPFIVARRRELEMDLGSFEAEDVNSLMENYEKQVRNDWSWMILDEGLHNVVR